MSSRTMFRYAGAMAAALIAASALAACGDNSSDANKAGGSTGNNINVYNGDSGNIVRNFNPFIDGARGGTRGMIYETLLFYNQGKANDIRPWLADKYEVAADGKSVTFNLHPGIKWTDGQPFTADDVVFTYELLKKYPQANLRGLPIAGAKKIDDLTAEVDLTRPGFADMWYLAGQTVIVAEHIWKNIADPTKDQNENPVGTGAFKLTQFSTQSYTLSKNDQYWQPGKPKLNSLRFVSYNGNTAALTALNAGKIDWASIFIPDIEKAYVAKDPQHNKYVNIPPGFIANLVPNLDKWPTSELPVRQAINLALDREQIAKLAFSGAHIAPPNPAAIIEPRDSQYLAPEFQGKKLTQDTAAAQQTLTDAGYTKGSDGIFVDKQGRKLSINCLVITGYTDYISALQIMKQQLKTVGIDFNYQELSYSSFTAKRNTGDYQLEMDAAYGGPGPYYLYNYMLNSKTTAPIGKQATSNYARFRDPQVDKLLGDASGTQDPEKQKQAYYSIQRIYVQKLPYIEVTQVGALTEFRTERLSGFPTAENPYALPVTWSQPDIGVVAAELTS
ncbi:MAG TPA: ABC transporter substrate-binding protein [Mycobacteriales bacterium]|nr:ABC transporter substrate-binding protein [Mycobacteriales bacterium]